MNETRVWNTDGEVETGRKLQYAEEMCQDVKSHKEWRAMEPDLIVDRSANNTRAKQQCIYCIQQTNDRFIKYIERPTNALWFYGCQFNPLNAELNPISYLLALLAHHFLHVSRIRVKSLTLRLLMSYILTYSMEQSPS